MISNHDCVVLPFLWTFLPVCFITVYLTTGEPWTHYSKLKTSGWFEQKAPGAEIFLDWLQSFAGLQSTWEDFVLEEIAKSFSIPGYKWRHSSWDSRSSIRLWRSFIPILVYCKHVYTSKFQTSQTLNLVSDSCEVIPRSICAIYCTRGNRFYSAKRPAYWFMINWFSETSLDSTHWWWLRLRTLPNKCKYTHARDTEEN